MTGIQLGLQIQLDLLSTRHPTAQVKLHVACSAQYCNPESAQHGMHTVAWQMGNARKQRTAYMTVLTVE